MSSLRPGDTVVLASVAQCGTCWMCARGAFVNCEGVAERRPTLRRPDGAAVPSFAGLGTFGDYAVVDENAAVAVRTDLPVKQLALIGCGVHNRHGRSPEHRQGAAGIDGGRGRAGRHRPVHHPGGQGGRRIDHRGD